MTYQDACDRAATDQGLDPITAALESAGIPRYVDQTGGFCMTVNIPLREGSTHYMYAVDAVDHASGPEGWVSFGEYWDCEKLYGTEYHGEGLVEWEMDQARPSIPYNTWTAEQHAEMDAISAKYMCSLDDLPAVVREAARAERDCPYCVPTTRETLVA